jgi:hypothetical protein
MKGASSASPFIPGGVAEDAATPAPDPDLQALQLTGISIIGDDQRFNFVDSRTKRSFWVALGGSEGAFSVDAYDSNTDSVVVRKGAQTRRLELRQSKIGTVAPPAVTPRPLPPLTTAQGVPAANVPGVDEIRNPKTPAEVKQAEFEARMLVSDLLEISMQERARQRALREAQARAAAAQN